MSTAVVTGVTGQDGGYLAEQLVADGARVHGVIRPGEQPGPHLVALGDALTLHVVDLQDLSAVAALLDQVAPDQVFNLVGVSSVAQSWAEPALTLAVNGVVVAVLLQALLGSAAVLVQASSAEIFAGSGVSPQDEGTPLVPRSPYGTSKAVAHQLVQAYRERGLAACNAILYNHESPRRPISFVTRKITSTVAAIARGETDRLVLGNLEARRDWGWAPDYVRALRLLAAHPDVGDVVVATGRSHTVREFAAAAFAAAGIPERIESDPAFARPYDAADLVGRPDRARELLGWQPLLGFAEVVGAMVEADLAG